MLTNSCCTYSHSYTHTRTLQGKQHKEIHFSFKKLMRACSPSSPGGGAFLGAIEDSEWLNQLSNLLQLAGAIVDLIDLQSSSVLVALENGWDYTAQVSVYPSAACMCVGLLTSSLKVVKHKGKEICHVIGDIYF